MCCTLCCISNYLKEQYHYCKYVLCSKLSKYHLLQTLFAVITLTYQVSCRIFRLNPTVKPTSSSSKGVKQVCYKRGSLDLFSCKTFQQRFSFTPGESGELKKFTLPSTVAAELASMGGVDADMSDVQYQVPDRSSSGDRAVRQGRNSRRLELSTRARSKTPPASAPGASTSSSSSVKPAKIDAGEFSERGVFVQSVCVLYRVLSETPLVAGERLDDVCRLSAGELLSQTKLKASLLKSRFFIYYYYDCLRYLFQLNLPSPY